jgi:hypothetical protein
MAEMSIDPGFERAVIAELALSGRRGRRRDPSHGARALCKVPGRAGFLARVVARAEIEDRLDGARAEGETLAALRLLPDPWMAT